jgi:SMI1/KNR4 family protein SUKH-1
MATNLPELTVTGELREVPTDAELDDAAAQLGLTLPPSYRTFARRYGHGLTGELFIIFVPMDKTGFDWSSGLVDRSSELKEELAESLAAKTVRFQPSGSPEIVGRLVPFGASENGDILAWDPGEPSSEDGELWIYVIGSRKGSVWRSAPDLADFLTRMSQPQTGKVLPRANFDCPRVFQPRPGRGHD